MMRIVAAMLLLALSNCALVSGTQPLAVVCGGCALLSGLCSDAGLRRAECPVGQQLYIINYKDVLEKQVEPALECR